MKKFSLILLIIIGTLNCAGKNFEEIADNIFKNLETKSENELIQHLKIASKNYQGQYDPNVLVPLEILKKRGDKSVNMLGDALFDEKNYREEVRIQIIRILGEMQNDQAIPYLQKAAKSSDNDISVPAASSLSRYKDYTADALIEQLNKVMNDDKKRFNVLQDFSLKSYRNLRGSDKAYNALIPLILDENMEIHSRQTALLALAGINIQSEEILTFCRKIIPDDSVDPMLRTAAIYVVSRFKRLDFLDLIYNTIIETPDMQVVLIGLRQFTEYQHPFADQKINDFKELMKDEVYLKNKQKKVNEYYTKTKIRDDDRGKSRDAFDKSKKIEKSYQEFIEFAERNTERMNKEGIKIP